MALFPAFPHRGPGPVCPDRGSDRQRSDVWEAQGRQTESGLCLDPQIWKPTLGIFFTPRTVGTEGGERCPRSLCESAQH